MPQRAEVDGKRRVLIGGVAVDCLTLDETVGRCLAAIDQGGQVRQVSINAAKTVNARRDPLLRAALADASIASADGQSIVWASRLLRQPLPERVAGIDLMHALLRATRDKSLRFFVLGASEGVLNRGIERLSRQYPHANFVGWRNGYFSESDVGRVNRAIEDTHPDVVLVAMDSPRKEIWIHRHSASLGAPVVVGVGGAIDIAAGAARRAPRALQALGLEWAFRLVQEPRRLWRRYLVTNTVFLAIVIRSVALGRRGAG